MNEIRNDLKPMFVKDQVGSNKSTENASVMTLRGSCAYEVFLTFFSFKATALVLFIVSFLIKGVILNTNLTTVEVKLGRLSIMANMWSWNWTERRNHWSNNKTILGKKQNIRYHLNLSFIIHISYFSFTNVLNKLCRAKPAVPPFLVILQIFNK